MLVVADASPVNVLVRIQLVGILPRIFGAVIIPPTVAHELSHASTPHLVRDWVASRPSWLEIRAPLRVDSSLPVDPGEQEAISLAREIHADLLLVDDRKARRTAQEHGLRIAGTLGVLEIAAARGMVDLQDAVSRLRTTDFAISDRLLDEAIDRDRRRRR